VNEGTISLPGMDFAEQGSPRDTLSLNITRDLCYECSDDVIVAVRTSLSHSPREIILDLGDVTTVDSSGLRALLLSRSMCEAAGVGFKLAQVSDCVARIMQMSGLEHTFGLHIDPNIAERKTRPSFCRGPVPWKTYEHVATSNPELISVLRERICDAAGEVGVDEEILCDIKIAVGEALTNAYRHGSPKKGVNKIRVRCMTCPTALVVEIEDEGLPFDPNATLEPDPKKMRDHGMGLYLMRQAMDVVEFHNRCPGNRVRMIKWLPSAAPRPASRTRKTARMRVYN